MESPTIEMFKKLLDIEISAMVKLTRVHSMISEVFSNINKFVNLSTNLIIWSTISSAVVSEKEKTSSCCGDGTQHGYSEGLFHI